MPSVTNPHPEETREALFKSDPKLVSVDVAKYTKLASDAVLAKTKAALEAKKVNVAIVDTKEKALEYIKANVPKGKTVFNTHSTSLEEIGLVEHMKADKDWVNLHSKVFAEQDPAKQAALYKAGHNADFVFGSATAISEEGDITAADLTGTKTGAFIYHAGTLFLVVGTHKIVPTYEDCVKRTHQYCLPVESARVRIAYKVPASSVNNFVAIRGPNPFSPVSRVTVLFVKEPLGY